KDIRFRRNGIPTNAVSTEGSLWKLVIGGGDFRVSEGRGILVPWCTKRPVRTLPRWP
ncbi:hypothetical protein FRC11_013470, partial [Ceratobasidium sp. 423]